MEKLWPSFRTNLHKDPYDTALNNLKLVIDNSGSLTSFPTEFDWQNYGAVRGTFKKYNEKVREMFVQQLEGPIKDKYSKK